MHDMLSAYHHCLPESRDHAVTSWLRVPMTTATAGPMTRVMTIMSSSALAAVAEHPGAIEKLFLTREVNPRGKYVIQIFCVRVSLSVSGTEDRSVS